MSQVNKAELAKAKAEREAIEAKRLAEANAKAEAIAKAEATFVAFAKADGENADNWPRAAMHFTAQVGAKLWRIEDAERLTKAYLTAKAEAAPLSARAEMLAKASDSKAVKSTVSTLKSFASPAVVALGQAFFDDILRVRERQSKDARKRTMLALYAANVKLTGLAKSLNWVTDSMVREGYDALAERETVLSSWCGKAENVKSLGAKMAEALGAMATKLDGEKTVMFAFPESYGLGLDIAADLRKLADRILAEEREMIERNEAADIKRLAEAAEREAAETAKALKEDA